MKPGAAIEFSAEKRKEVAAWIDANSATAPESVRAFFALHKKYLDKEGDPSKSFNSVCVELRRAMRIVPSSEKRRSGRLLAGVSKKKSGAGNISRATLEAEIEREERLCGWHRGLDGRHEDRAHRLKEKLVKMSMNEAEAGERQQVEETIRLEDIVLSEAKRAEIKAAREEFTRNMGLGDGPDPSMMSVNETLMPGGAVLASEEHVPLSAIVPDELADAEVIKTMSEPRVRYDFAVSVTRIELDVEKKVVVDHEGERRMITASTHEYGPPRYSVTWSALATLAIMVGQFALPFHRLATMLSTAGKTFTASALSRMLHYVAERFLPIYFELAEQLKDSEILAGDDTSCRVIEVSTYFLNLKLDSASSKEDKRPWAEYRTPEAAEASIRQCEERREARIRRRQAGDREATPTPEESPSLGMLIGRRFPFESHRKNGDGAKESMNTTVVSGRSVAADPRSLIVFYRSHLGGCGNLLESILTNRKPDLSDVVIQSDLSTTNLISSPELRSRLKVKWVGCYAHARRPFANYEHEDPERCAHILHLFLGLAMYEMLLDERGRNRQNVLAVRRTECRELWDKILRLSKEMAEIWPPASKLGTGARYIINHFDKLTAYLDDPRIEPTNNLRERMLRTEKLIEGSAMFRRTLEGRFVLDIVRTVLQTAVAAGVPVHQYIVWLLRSNPDDVARDPARFTPRAWAEVNLDAAPEAAAPVARSA